MNIAVVFGGVSCEHDISIITACQVMNVLKEKHEVIPIYIDKKGIWQTGDNLLKINSFPNNLGKTHEVIFSNSSDMLYVKKLGKFKKFLKIDMVFISLHGKNGEDGAVASIFELNGIPYANAGICSSAVACDKSVFKEFIRGLHIPCVKSFTLSYDEFKQKRDFYLNSIENKIGYPIILKPANLGSSIGISIVENGENLSEELNKAFSFDSKLLIEKLIEDIREINVAIYKKGNDLIVSELPNAESVKIMGLEMFGNAARNQEDVWIPYRTAFEYSKNAILNLINHKISVALYNFPLCAVDSDCHLLCAKSITGYKVRFDERCETCKKKPNCGGIFAGTIRLAGKDVIPQK